jgi:hypothetical protein
MARTASSKPDAKGNLEGRGSTSVRVIFEFEKEIGHSRSEDLNHLVEPQDLMDPLER